MHDRPPLARTWRARAQRLTDDVHALLLARRDPRVPWYAKALAVCVVAYALSPIDLIPDAIPVLGYLDDLVLLPLGILVVRRMIPTPVLEDCRRHARTDPQEGGALGRWAAGAVVLAWVASLVAGAAWAIAHWHRAAD